MKSQYFGYCLHVGTQGGAVAHCSEVSTGWPSAAPGFSGGVAESENLQGAGKPWLSTFLVLHWQTRVPLYSENNFDRNMAATYF